MKRVVIALLFGAVGLAACGDGKVEANGETIGYRYQGKPDVHAWDSPEAGGAKAERERQIEARTLNQNEYTRTR